MCTLALMRLKLFSSILLIALSLFAYPKQAFGFNIFSFLEKLHYDIAPYHYSQVKGFFSLPLDSASAIWIAGDYYAREKLFSADSVIKFERTQGGIGYRYFFSPKCILGVYSSLEFLDAFSRGKHQPDPDEDQKHKHRKPHPLGFELIFPWCNFNIDTYFLWKLITPQGLPTHVPWLIKDKGGISMKFTSNYFNYINPFFSVYYGRVGKPSRLYGENIDLESINAVGGVIGVKFIFSLKLLSDMKPMLVSLNFKKEFDNINKRSWLNSPYLSIQLHFDGINQNTASLSQRLSQPVEPYLPLYIG